MTRNSLTLFVAIAVILAVVPGAVAGDDIRGTPELDATVADSSLVPGTERTLTVNILNDGRLIDGSNTYDRSQVTTANGVTVTVEEKKNTPIDVLTGRQAVGTVSESKIRSVSVPISVPADAEPGTYEVPVTISYSYTFEISNTGDETERTRTVTIPVEVEIREDARFEVVGVDSEVRVGATDTVNVTVENVGTERASDASLVLESSNADLTLGTSDRASRGLGVVRPGEVRSVQYEVTADRSAKPQRYAMDLFAEYEDPDGIARQSATKTIGVVPTPEQTFSVVETESAVTVGDTGTVSVTMRNEGPLSVTDARVELASLSAAVEFAGSEAASRFVGAWAPNETRTVTYDITATDDAEPRSYVLESTVSYRDEEGDSATAPTRSLGVTPGPERAFEILDTSSTLSVGSEGTVTGTVQNTGETTFDSAVVVYTGSSETVTAIESEAPVGNLEPGESADFSLPFEIASSAEAGPKQLTVAVQYRNDDGEQVTTDSFDVRAAVGPDDPEFDLQIEDATVTAGGSTQLRVTVTNADTETLSSISAKLFAEDPLSTSDDEAFIDRLEPGQSETVVFDVSASGAALSKTYPIEMDFQYDDSDGDTLTSDTYRLAMDVTTTSDADAGGFPVLPVVAVVAIVIAGVGYYLYRD
ncbi:MAG: COG1361 S-layer family protein [Salinirussus sp.]